MKKILIAVGVVVLAVAGWVVWSRVGAPGGEVACTLEAKLCPDGSSVGRTGPNCEFAPCPTPRPTTSGSGIQGTVMLGPTCPVEYDPPRPECADKPYATKLAVTTVDGSRVIKEFSSAADGTFRVSVPPGEYVIRAASTAGLYPSCHAGPIRVSASAYTTTSVKCDTGIR